MRQSHSIILVVGVVTIACVVPPRWMNPVDNARLRFAVWGMPFEDRLFDDVYARGFEELHPGVAVQYEKYVDVTDKYFAWHTIGTGADVMRVRITDYHALVAQGALAPLNDFIYHPDADIGLSADGQADFLPAVWDPLEIDGERYALPSDSAQYGLYYNKTIFDAYNAAHPDAVLKYPNAEWTWDDLRAAAARLTIIDEDGRVEQYGIDFFLWAWPFMAFFEQAGGELWDAEQTSTLIDSTAGADALQLIVDLLPHAVSARSPEQVETATGPDKLFATGQTAMLLDGSWRAPFLELTNPDLDFAIAPLPRGAQPGVVSGSVVWAISSHSRNKEIAWQMIRWMTEVEQALRYWDMLRVAPPASQKVIESEDFRETSGLVSEDGEVIVPPMPRDKWEDRGAWLLYGIRPHPLTGEPPAFIPVAPYQADLEDKIGTMLSRAVSPSRNESLEELLRESADAVDQIIDRDRRARGLPPIPRE